jgi:hypothetical protein
MCHIELSKTHVPIKRTLTCSASTVAYILDGCTNHRSASSAILDSPIGDSHHQNQPWFHRVGGSSDSEGRDCTRRPRMMHCDKRDDRLMLCFRSGKSPRDGGQMAPSGGTSIDCYPEPESMEAQV